MQALREQHWQRAAQTAVFDLVVIGGGATGLGIAVDAAARGYQVALFEAIDFGKGTSSRATKLLHGGVRYLAQGHLSLVREALRERAVVMANAPHLAQPLAFLMPAQASWKTWFYGIGLIAYDVLAGDRSLGRTRRLGSANAKAALPWMKPQGVAGAVQFWDGQFDDARLAVTLARTAAHCGAVVLNHTPVDGLLHQDGRVCGVQVRDALTQRVQAVRAGCVINAAGVWVERVLAMDKPHAADGAHGAASDAHLGVTPSQGVHLVFDADVLPLQQGVVFPQTSDGRVLFAVPWLGKTVVGTTDTLRDDVPLEPQPTEAEVDWILAELSRHLQTPPTRADIRSQWAGLRPLVRPSADAAGSGGTKSLSREHSITQAVSGLVSVWGGKWTTYRAMAEDVLRFCVASGCLPARQTSVTTAKLPLVGAPKTAQRRISLAPTVALYGTEQGLVASLPGAHRWLWRCGEGAGLTEAMVRFAVRYEMARTVEDVLARRCRVLFLDARAAKAVAPAVAELLAQELGDVASGALAGASENNAAQAPRDAQANTYGLRAFEHLADQYAGFA